MLCIFEVVIACWVPTCSVRIPSVRRAYVLRIFRGSTAYCTLLTSQILREIMLYVHRRQSWIPGAPWGDSSHVLRVFRAHSLDHLCAFCVHFTCVFPPCSLLFDCVFSRYSLRAVYVFPAYSLRAPCVCRAYFLAFPCVDRASSPRNFRPFTRAFLRIPVHFSKVFRR